MHWALVVGGLAALYLSRAVFARPRPSVLDPALAAYRQERVGMAAAEEERAAKGRRMYQPGETERSRAEAVAAVKRSPQPPQQQQQQQQQQRVKR